MVEPSTPNKTEENRKGEVGIGVDQSKHNLALDPDE